MLGPRLRGIDVLEKLLESFLADRTPCEQRAQEDSFGFVRIVLLSVPAYAGLLGMDRLVDDHGQGLQDLGLVELLLGDMIRATGVPIDTCE